MERPSYYQELVIHRFIGIKIPQVSLIQRSEADAGTSLTGTDAHSVPLDIPNWVLRVRHQAFGISIRFGIGRTANCPSLRPELLVTNDIPPWTQMTETISVQDLTV